MSGPGYKQRKRFIKEVKKATGRQAKAKRKWPYLEEGQYVYYVKDLVTKVLTYVVARSREEAEAGHVGAVRSMPIRSWKEQSPFRKREEG